MNSKLSGLMLGLVCITAVAGPAIAGGDVIYGGIKDYKGNAVPVPAPVPVPEAAAVWYLRGDVTVGFGSDPDASESGMTFGEVEYPSGFGAAAPFGLPGSAVQQDYEQYVQFGVGVGYKWTDYFRTDATLETAREQKVRIRYSDSVPLVQHNPALPAAGPNDTLNVDVNDESDQRGAVALFNAYYDFKNSSRFTPYIGGGLGFQYVDINRTNTTTETVTQYDPSGNATTTARYSVSPSGGGTALSFAAALAVGFSYAVTDITELDFGYRYLYTGGTDVDLNVNGNGSKVSIEDSHDHQIRAGVRFNVF